MCPERKNNFQHKTAPYKCKWACMAKRRTSRVKLFAMEISINVDFEKDFQFAKGESMVAMEGGAKGGKIHFRNCGEMT